MKAIWMIIIVSMFIVLAGCVKIEKQCGYALDYNHRYYDNPNCGPRIFHRCDPVCDLCSAKGPACTACLSCIKDDACY